MWLLHGVICAQCRDSVGTSLLCQNAAVSCVFLISDSDFCSLIRIKIFTDEKIKLVQYVSCDVF